MAQDILLAIRSRDNVRSVRHFSVIHSARRNSISIRLARADVHIHKVCWNTGMEPVSD